VKDRITGIVSRGGDSGSVDAITINKIHTPSNDIIEIFKKYDVSFSLGDSLRPGCTHDASDAAQLN